MKMSAYFDYKLHIFRSPKLKSVVDDAIEFFGQTPVHALPPSGSFAGCGVYALYYSGDYKPYAKLSEANSQACTQPIYVGKAVPKGWRAARAVASQGSGLYGRLKEHANNIRKAKNIRIDDFKCRFVILENVEADLIGTVEAGLIRRFQPLWNTIVDGFGNHDPGSGRYNQARSEWDVLHPGRAWVDRLTGKAPRLEDILAKVKKHLSESTLL